MLSLVVIRYNLVEEIRHGVKCKGDVPLLRTNLEAGILLSKNYQTNGCIDGEYWFDDLERSKAFAEISMDFVKKVLEFRIEQIGQLSQQEEYIAQTGNSPLVS